MKNPYKHLYIYYFEGIPEITAEVERSKDYLGNWIDDDISFLFFSSARDELVAEIDASSSNASLADSYQMTGEEWHGDKIEPYHINNLLICPPWNRPEPDKENEIPIILDPGVVFGTGRHQTTEDCLYLVHRLFQKHQIESMLDIGTGTGLLAIGAAALGCPKVFACDFNYLAVKTCRNNIRLNEFEDKVVAFQARGEQILSLDADLIVANIHYDIMRQIIQSPEFYSRKWMILSGLLNSETVKVMAVLREKGIQIKERHCPDGVWNTLLCQRLKKC